ncbi:MAG: hypothetical protein ACRENY_09700 [Candidatus Dormibacteria bacterium]
MAVPLVALSAGCANSTTSGQVVPFAPLAVPAVSSPSPEGPPPATPACLGSKLAGSRGPDMALTGQQLLLMISIWNPTARTCQLSGTPTVQLLAASGTPIPVSLQPSWSQLASGGGASGPVLLQPEMHGPGARGEAAAGEASLIMVWSPVLDGGPSCPGTAPTAATTDLEIGDQPLTVNVTPQPGELQAAFAPCQGLLGVGSFQASAEATPSPEASPSAAARKRPTQSQRLTGRLNLPGRVRSGSVLRYQVVLTNRSDRRLQFTTKCAAFTESAVSRAHHYKLMARYQLNCAKAEAIAPGQSRIFAMALPTHRSASAIRLQVRWAFAPGADLTLTPHSILSGHVTLANSSQR